MSVASPWARQTALAMQRLGNEVHVFDFRTDRTLGLYLRRADQFQIRNIEGFEVGVAGVHFINTRFGSSLRYVTGAASLRRLARLHRCDVLIALYAGGFATLGWLSRVRPFSVCAVGSDILFCRGVGRMLRRRVLESAAVVFANGRYLAEETLRLAPGASVVQTCLGVELEEFVPVGVPERRPRIVCTRGFLPVYNNGYLVEGLAVNRNWPSDMEVVFTSGGPLLDSVRGAARRSLPPDRLRSVKFLGGLSREGMLEALQASRVFVSLSKSDGTATSLLEALACGLVPVLSDIPQNREWIGPGAGGVGLLVPLGRPDALADALMEGTLSEDVAVRARRDNRRLVETKGDCRRNTAEMVASLRSCISVRPHS